MFETKTIKKGFNSSTGWNLGNNGISIHLFDPFISVPKNGTSTKKNKKNKNKIIENLIKSSCANDEKKIIKKTPIPI